MKLFHNFLKLIRIWLILGAAAYTGSVTHSLSIAVIVCETTGQLSPLLPVLVCYLFRIFELHLKLEN